MPNPNTKNIQNHKIASSLPIPNFNYDSKTEPKPSIKQSKQPTNLHVSSPTGQSSSPAKQADQIFTRSASKSNPRPPSNKSLKMHTKLSAEKNLLETNQAFHLNPKIRTI
jgi:hypothetical protein